jgi:hypothetical protein
LSKPITDKSLTWLLDFLIGHYEIGCFSHRMPKLEAEDFSTGPEK